MDKVIYTLGHSNYDLEKFLNLIRKYNIDCIVDIRGIPYSSFNTQYNREPLRAFLKRENILYIYMGNEFAVQRNNTNLYNEKGYPDFKKVILDKDFLNGVKRLKNGIEKGFTIGILGAKQDPINCHRYILVGRYLNNIGLNLKYILDDGSLKTHEELEEDLLNKFFKNRDQMTLEEIIRGDSYKNELLEKAYEESNYIIAVRFEHIDKT